MESQANGCKSKVNVDLLRIETGVWGPVRSWMTEAGVPTCTLQSFISAKCFRMILGIFIMALIDHIFAFC